MVFFTCSACGESLKKAQVEKHLLKCRACQVLSCIDCSKDFWGDDYKNHNKCISEEQKYGGKDFQAKVNKGDVKQQQWIQRIQQAMEQPGVEPNVQKILQKINTHDMVPRKKAKFENWMKNCLKINDPLLLEKVWEICSTTADSNSNHQTASDRENRSGNAETNRNERGERKNKKNKRKTLEENSEEQNGKNREDKQTRKKRKLEEKEQNADEESNKKQKKRKQEVFDESLNPEGEEPESQDTGSNSTGKFHWKGTIKAVLRDAPEDGLAVKKLRKKVLAAYYSFTGDANFRSEEELLSLFNKKINKNPKFKILKDKVRLVK